jgi:hypothetical protein
MYQVKRIFCVERYEIALSKREETKKKRSWPFWNCYFGFFQELVRQNHKKPARKVSASAGIQTGHPPNTITTGAKFPDVFYVPDISSNSVHGRILRFFLTERPSAHRSFWTQCDLSAFSQEFCMDSNDVCTFRSAYLICNRSIVLGPK